MPQRDFNYRETALDEQSWFYFTGETGGGGKGESRLNFSDKLPLRLPAKIGNFLTSTRKIKSIRPNFEKKKGFATTQ